jgi:hypothetical protein
MNCEEVRPQLPDFLAGSIDPAARQAIDLHLGGCPGCGEAVEMWAKLGSLVDEQPSPALGARFEAMLAAYRAGAGDSQILRRPRFGIGAWLESWWPREPALQFGVALICLVAGGVAGHLAAARSSGGREIAELRQEVQKTRQLVAISLLQQQSASDRLRGVNYSFRMAQADQEVLEALVYAVRYDTSVDVRLGAVDTLRGYAGVPRVREGLMEAMRGSQSPLVQIALIDLMVEARERQSIDVLKQLRDDQAANQAVRERAGWGLRQL